MHASSTLPAFVLSQNQTLRILKSKPDLLRPQAAADYLFRVLIMKFPSTNLLCCRASPPAPRRHHLWLRPRSVARFKRFRFQRSCGARPKTWEPRREKTFSALPRSESEPRRIRYLVRKKETIKNRPAGSTPFFVFLKKSFSRPSERQCMATPNPLERSGLRKNAARFKRHQKARKNFPGRPKSVSKTMGEA